MLIDGLQMLEGSSAQNLTVAKGTSFPASPTEGELFYRTDGVNEGLYVYNGESWTQSGGNAFDASSNQTITGTWSFTNAVSGVTPTASNHLVTKSYADALASGVDPKDSVRAATTANITLSGTQTVDGVALSVGDRVLVKNQSVGTQNGLYVVAAGAWTRTSDFDGSPSSEVTSGAYVFVTGGSTNGQKGFILTTNDPITIGATVQSWTQFSGSATTVDLTGATGNITVSNLNSGTNATAASFWRGDGTWSPAVTSIGVSGGTTGLTTSGGPITSSGTITLGGTLAIANGGTGATTASQALNNLLPAQGSAAGKVLSSNGSVGVWDSVPAAGTAVNQVQVRDGSGYMNYSATTFDAGGMTLATNTANATYTGEAGADVRLLGTDVETGLIAAGTTGVVKIQSATVVNIVTDGGTRWTINEVGALALQSVYGTAGQVLTTQGAGAIPTWSTPTSAAGALTGTTLAANVVSSSLTSVGTITSGTWSGSFGAVSGANLTSLNASNLSTGTVGTARLGSGTANSTTFLRGDGTWTAASVSSLSATSTVNLTTGTTGVYAALSGTPYLAWVNAGAGADVKASFIDVSAAGTIAWKLTNDAVSGTGTFMSVTRAANVASSITLTSTALNLAVGTGGLQLNGSAGTSGQILTSAGSAAPTWSSNVAVGGNIGSSGVTTVGSTTAGTEKLNVIGSIRSTSSATNFGTGAEGASIDFVSGTAVRIGHVNGASGSAKPIQFLSGGSTVATISTAGLITANGGFSGALTGNVTGVVTGSLIGSGNQAVSAGTTAALAGVLSGGGASFNGRSTVALVSSSASAGNRVWGRQVAGSGDLFEYLWDDTQSAGTAWLQVNRSANTATNITLTGTAITAAARVDFGASYTELNTAVTATTSTSINCALGNIFTVTMSASITTLSFSNVPASGRAYNMTLILKQDGTGGRSITWPAAVKFPGATAPTLSSANKTDIVTLLTTDGGTIWYATVGGQNF